MTKTNDEIIALALAALTDDATPTMLAESLRAFDNDMMRMIDAYYHDLRDDEPLCDCTDTCDHPNLYDLIRDLPADADDRLMRDSIQSLTAILTNAILP